MFDREKLEADCRLIREKSPLIHNITNYVAMTPSANALLAIGASPLMSFYPAEMEDVAKISGALVVNLGCLDDEILEAAEIACKAAHKRKTPWVLDPVGAGATSCRTSSAASLALDYHPSIIRGNASEICALSGAVGASTMTSEGPRGVDSVLESLSTVDDAKALAALTGAVVVVSGAVDYICGPEKVETVTNGSPIMARVTAMGCTASAVCGAFAAVDPDPFSAALCAMALMGISGEKAAEGCSGTGSFQVEFLDILSTTI